jgi:hypothetical protein
MKITIKELKKIIKEVSVTSPDRSIATHKPEEKNQQKKDHQRSK